MAMGCLLHSSALMGDLRTGMGSCTWDAACTGKLQIQGGGREGISFQGNCAQIAQGSPESQSLLSRSPPDSPIRKVPGGRMLF